MLDSLPLTPNGKLDRKALPAPDQTRPELDETFVAPQTHVEKILASIFDPVQTTADERPARFVRIEKAVGLPDDEVRDFRGTAFGAAGGLGMREILGYAPVEPDGSVRIKVPAGVPFGVGVLDADGRRLRPRHLNWLQLRAGEVLTCNGCHIPANAQPGGLPAVRTAADLFVAVNAGAATTGQPFPNSNPAIFANQGETMAEAARARHCQTDCAALPPSVDVLYDDVWTDPDRVGPRGRRAVRLSLCRPHDAGADLADLPVGLVRAVPHHDPLPETTFIRSGPCRA